jgi:tetratricopeptide (TPR) repeat protein/tRNA A-37 threonylcarbamoyl transferase component Bud32
MPVADSPPRQQGCFFPLLARRAMGGEQGLGLSFSAWLYLPGAFGIVNHYYSYIVLRHTFGDRPMRKDSDLALPPDEVISISDHASAWREQWQKETVPDLREFLKKIGALETSQLIAVLLIDQEERWRRGDQVPVEDYLRRFPDLAEDETYGLGLVQNEILLRQHAGENPHLEEYSERFPQFAAALREQMEAYQTVSQSPVRPEIPDYEILQELGRGGMGVVYQARHVPLKRLVALKMIRVGELAGPDELARFRTEAEAAARLQHPNIVQIHEIGEHKGLPFLALEFVSGTNLARYLHTAPLLPQEAAILVETLGRAMAYAHERGVLHRDLKPANILLNDERKTMSNEQFQQFIVHHSSFIIPKITDFGLAKKLDDPERHTQTGAILGTASYMAPEQASGNSKDMGPAVDVYALGAILYETLTGRPPFQGATLLDTLDQVTNKEPVPPRQLQPKMPRDLETICLKCLQKDPRKRFASAQALADDLRRFLEGKPIQARPVGWAERSWRWCRRNRVVAGLTGAVLLGVVGLVVATVLLFLQNAALVDANEKETQARILADQRFEKEMQARELADQRYDLAYEAVFNYLEGLSRDPALKETDPLLLGVKLLETGLPLIKKLANQKPRDPKGELSKAKVYGELAKNLFNLGKTESSLENYQKMEITYLKLAKDYPDVKDYRLNLSMSYKGQAVIHFKKSGPVKAAPFLEKAIALLERLSEENPDEDEYLRQLAVNYTVLGIYLRSSEVEKAEQALRLAVKTLSRLMERSPNSVFQLDLANARGDLATLLLENARLDEALEELDKARVSYQALAKKYPTFDHRYYLILNYNDLGVAHLHLGQKKKANLYFLAGIAQCQKLEADFPDRPNYIGLSGLLYEGHGHVAEKAVDPEKWETKFTRGLINPSVEEYWKTYLHLGRAQAFSHQGKFQRALADIEQALAKDKENNQVFIRMLYALCLAQASKFEQARKEAKTLDSEKKHSPNTCFQLARVFALAWAEPDSSAAQKKADADAAWRWLLMAKSAGYFAETDNLQFLHKHADFQPLLGDSDFRKKLEENKLTL